MQDSDKWVVGVDIGGCHIGSAIFNLKTKQILPSSYQYGAINKDGDVNTVMSQWAKVINASIEAAKDKPLLGIGFGMPGAFDYQKGIALFRGNAKYENLYGVHIATQLGKYISRPLMMRYINDTAAFGIGFQRLRGQTGKFIALTLGTGFGSTFISNGVPQFEGSDIPDGGSLWHVPFKDGIADDYISTRWFQQSFKRDTDCSLCGVEELVFRRRSNPEFQIYFDEFGTTLGTILAPWVKSFKAEALILAGRISLCHELFEPAIVEQFNKSGISIPIKLETETESLSILGAAHLFEEKLWSEVQPTLPST